MHLHRRSFIAGIAAAIRVPGSVMPVRAAKHDDELPGHVHGLNGATIPGDKPINLKIRILDGPQFALQAYRGSAVVLNFFATWCPACREEDDDARARARQLRRSRLAGRVPANAAPSPAPP